MVGILTVIFAFIFFMVILDKAWLASLRPVALAIIIIISLFLGYIVASVLSLIFEVAIKTIIVLAVIILIIFLFSKNSK